MIENINNETASIRNEITGITICYRNTPAGRTELAAKCPPEIVAEVMAVWGDTPTVPDNVPQDEPPALPTTPTTTIEQRTAALESAMLAVMTAAQGGIADV